MAAAPVLPVSPAPTPEPSLSEGARILDTFVAPSKTFTDLRRNASWWGPFVVMLIVSTLFVYTAGQKVGFRKIMENQIQAQPKTQERLDKLSVDQREAQLEKGAKVTQAVAYVFPVFSLVIWLIIAGLLFATFKFAVGATVSFKASLAIVIYANLAMLLKTVLALLSLLTGVSPDSFTFQNPLASNPGYFMNPADSPFLYSIASQVDIFLIWTLVLTAIGFTCVSKVKQGTAFAIVFGWWAVLSMGSAGLGALFS